MENTAPQPTEDLLANEFKQRMINLINDFSSISNCRKEEIMCNIYTELKGVAESEVKKQFEEYQRSLETQKSDTSEKITDTEIFV